MMIFIMVLCIILTGLSLFYAIHKKIVIENKQLQYQEIDALLKIKEEEQKLLEENITKSSVEYIKLTQSAKLLEEKISDLKAEARITYEEQRKISEDALIAYQQILKNKYEDEEDKYSHLIWELENKYANTKLVLDAETDKINLEINNLKDELSEIKKERAAAVEAMMREQIVKDNLSSYCIQLADADKADVYKLEEIKMSLANPRILSMLIWQTWFQKPLKTLAANLLGSDAVTGIYKITNIKTGQCYIGQASNVANRWAEHCKCGLGIDTPPQNKLYQSMKEYHIWNFSWELLEVCDPSLLNEREKYYIEMYNSYEYGFNSTSGNKTKH